jgi:putative endonuclease
MGRPGNSDRRARHQGLTKQQIQGERAEEIAFQLLQRKGWVLLDRNWSCRWGELDLVLQKDQRLLVVEVKGRTAQGQDRGGLDSFHSRKRRRLARAINCWRSHNPDAGDQLLQVVLALVNLSGSATRVRWLAIHQLS